MRPTSASLQGTLGRLRQAPVPQRWVKPGDPEGSHLYQRLAHCMPVDDAGQPLSHMPYNAPFLLTDPHVAIVREWIEAGAQDD